MPFSESEFIDLLRRKLVREPNNDELDTLRSELKWVPRSVNLDVVAGELECRPIVEGDVRAWLIGSFRSAKKQERLGWRISAYSVDQLPAREGRGEQLSAPLGGKPSYLLTRTVAHMFLKEMKPSSVIEKRWRELKSRSSLRPKANLRLADANDVRAFYEWRAPVQQSLDLEPCLQAAICDACGSFELAVDAARSAAAKEKGFAGEVALAEVLINQESPESLREGVDICKRGVRSTKLGSIGAPGFLFRYHHAIGVARQGSFGRAERLLRTLIFEAKSKATTREEKSFLASAHLQQVELLLRQAEANRGAVSPRRLRWCLRQLAFVEEAYCASANLASVRRLGFVELARAKIQSLMGDPLAAQASAREARWVLIAFRMDRYVKELDGWFPFLVQ